MTSASSSPASACALLKIDIATGRLEQMAEFYAGALGIELRSAELHGHRHYLGDLGGIGLCLAPDAAAGVAPGTLGVHQLNLRVASVMAVVAKTRELGCEAKEHQGQKTATACVWDPDGNPVMVYEA